MKHFLSAAALSLALIAPAHAAIEINETDFGPSYGSAVADITIGKPLQLVGAVIGTALHVVGLPFSAASNSIDETYEVLVDKPWRALHRCTGCTPAYDSYIKSQTDAKNQVRFTVDRPSEIVINSDGTVVVSQ